MVTIRDEARFLYEAHRLELVRPEQHPHWETLNREAQQIWEEHAANLRLRGSKPSFAAIPNWKPQDSVCFIFSDASGSRQTTATLVEDLHVAARRNGFKLAIHGTTKDLAKHFHRQYNADGTFRVS